MYLKPYQVKLIQNPCASKLQKITTTFLFPCFSSLNQSINFKIFLPHEIQIFLDSSRQAMFLIFLCTALSYPPSSFSHFIRKPLLYLTIEERFQQVFEGKFTFKVDAC